MKVQKDYLPQQSQSLGESHPLGRATEVPELEN